MDIKISFFWYGTWYLFCLVFTRRKKWERSVWKKKRAKWRKGKERLQIANNHSYCLDVSSLSVHLPEVSAPKVFNSQCIIIIECSGLIAGIHWLIACLAGVWKEGKGEGDSKSARSAKGTWGRAEGNSFHPPPLLADSHPNSLPHPFWTPRRLIDWKWSWLEGGYVACLTCLWIFCFKTGAVSFGACSILQYEKVRSSYIHKNQAYFPSTGSKKQFGIRDMVCVELLHECFTVYHLWIFIS